MFVGDNLDWIRRCQSPESFQNLRMPHSGAAAFVQRNAVAVFETTGEYARRIREAVANSSVGNRIMTDWNQYHGTWVITWALIFYTSWEWLASGETIRAAIFAASLMFAALVGRSLPLILPSLVLSPLYKIVVRAGQLKDPTTDRYLNLKEKVEDFGAGSSTKDPSRGLEVYKIDQKGVSSNFWSRIASMIRGLLGSESPVISRLVDKIFNPEGMVFPQHRVWDQGALRSPSTIWQYLFSTDQSSALPDNPSNIPAKASEKISSLETKGNGITEFAKSTAKKKVTIFRTNDAAIFDNGVEQAEELIAMLHKELDLAYDEMGVMENGLSARFAEVAREVASRYGSNSEQALQLLQPEAAKIAALFQKDPLWDRVAGKKKARVHSLGDIWAREIAEIRKRLFVEERLELASRRAAVIADRFAAETKITMPARETVKTPSRIKDKTDQEEFKNGVLESLLNRWSKLNPRVTHPSPTFTALENAFEVFGNYIWSFFALQIAGSLGSSNLTVQTCGLLDAIDARTIDGANSGFEFCVTCWIKPFVCTSGALFILCLVSPYTRSLFNRTKYAPYTPLAIFFAFALWRPVLLLIASTITYLNFSHISGILGISQEKPYLTVTHILVGLKCLKISVNTFSYYFLSHTPPPPLFPTITPRHLTAIIPYHFTKGCPPTPQFIATLNSIMTAGTKETILFASSLEAHKSATGFVFKYNSSNFLRPIFKETAINGAEIFLTAIKEVRTPFLAFVEEANVVWPSTLLRESLSAFEHPLTGIVAPAIEPSDAPIGVLDLMGPGRTRYLSIKQKFLRYLGRLAMEKYNIDNTATAGLDGGSTILSQTTLLIRSEILQSPSFRMGYVQTVDKNSYMTRFVQNNGFKTVFLNDSEVAVQVRFPSIAQERASVSWRSFIDKSLKEKRKEWRDSLRVLLVHRTTYGNFSWSTFSVHLSRFLEFPAVYSGAVVALPEVEVRGYVCPMIVILFFLNIVQNLGSLKRRPSDIGYFTVSICWNLVIEPVVGVIALLTAWK